MTKTEKTSQRSSQQSQDTLSFWFSRIDQHDERPAIISFGKEDTQEISAQELDDLSRRLANGLIRAGVMSDTPIVLLANSSPRWIASFLGVLRAGAVPVPLDVQYDDDALRHAIEDCDPQYVFVDRKRASRIEELKIEADYESILIDGEDDEGNGEDEKSFHRLLNDSSEDLPEPEADDTAVMFYTSGTTGPPKGVPLTHKNIAFQLQVLLDAELVHERDRVLLPLPLHHVYPLVVGLLTPLARGVPVVLPYSLTGPQIIRALKEAQVTTVVGVPRLYRALHEGIVSKVESSGWFARKSFHYGHLLSSWLRRRLGIRVGKWLLRPVHRQFGPSLRVLASGGSPLDDELAWQLESLGWQITVGYGLTETSPLLTMNPPGRARIGSAGRPIPEVDLRIEPVEEAEQEQQDGHEVGEILARGPSIFRGYHQLPEKTEEVFTDDGWFRTGDLGYFDDQEFLYIGGRKGTMIVTEGGENVQPDDVEDAYSESDAIGEIGVLEDDGRLVALIVPGKTGSEKDSLEDAIDQAVQERGEQLPSYQRLSEYRISRKPLPRTHLGKIQRHKLAQRYEDAQEEEAEAASGPVSLEDMSSDDRALLDDPAARQTWDLLVERYPDSNLSPDSNVRVDLDVDSLEWMNLSLSLSEKAGIEIDEEAIGEIETVRDLLEVASEATIEGDKGSVAAPLEDPEASLQESQRYHLQPHSRMESILSGGLLRLNRVLMRSVFRLETLGTESLPDAPILIAPNHASSLDALAVSASLPLSHLRSTYWAGWTKIMFSNPVMRLFSRLTRTVPVDPQRGVMSSLALGGAVLDRQRSLVWFPEGKRSLDGKLQPFRPGIGMLLEGRRVPVVPTLIEGTHESLPPGRWLPRPRKIRVTFRAPLDVDKLVQEDGDKESHVQISEALREAIVEMQKQSQDNSDEYR